MGLTMNQLFYDYVESQISKDGRGKKVLEALEAEFPLNTPCEKTTTTNNNVDNSKRVIVAIKKGANLQSPVIFFDKSDASQFISVPEGDDEKVGEKKEWKEFSSLGLALNYLYPALEYAPPAPPKEELKSAAPQKEELKSAAITTTEKASSTTAVLTFVTPKEQEKPQHSLILLPTPQNETVKKGDVPADEVKVSTATPKQETSTAVSNAAEDVAKKHPADDSNILEESAVKKRKVIASPSKAVTPSADKNKLWQQRYSELIALWDGSSTVYQHHITANKSLANWVKHQRKIYKQGTYSEERKQKLNAIGFKWVGRNSIVLSNQAQDEPEHVPPGQSSQLPAVKGTTVSSPTIASCKSEHGFISKRQDVWSNLWDLRFQELVEYKLRFGDTLVPKEWPEHKKLAGWIRKQREQYRKKGHGERVALTDSRIKQLEDIDFVWNLRPGRLKNPPPVLTMKGSSSAAQPSSDAKPQTTESSSYYVAKDGYLII